MMITNLLVERIPQMQCLRQEPLENLAKDNTRVFACGLFGSKDGVDYAHGILPNRGSCLLDFQEKVSTP